MRKFLEFCFGHVIHIFTSLLLLYLCLPQRSFLPHVLLEMFEYEMVGELSHFCAKSVVDERLLHLHRKLERTSEDIWFAERDFH